MPAVERLGALLKQNSAPWPTTRCWRLRWAASSRPGSGPAIEVPLHFCREGKQRARDAPRFHAETGEKILVVEDVITRGGRVQECLEIVKQMGGTTVAVAVLVDRSAGQARFDVPTYSLLEMSYPTYPADQVPEWLAEDSRR